MIREAYTHLESDTELQVSPAQLLVRAKSLYYNLQSVPEYLLKEDSTRLKNAIVLYKTVWLPLIGSGHQSLDSDDFLLPPRNIAWCWMCHMLAPESYEKDFRSVLDTAHGNFV